MHLKAGWWKPLLNIMTVSWQVEGPLHTCSVCSPLFQSFGCVELIKVNGTPPWYCCTSLLLNAGNAPLQDCHRQICKRKLCRCLASMTHTQLRLLGPAWTKCVSATRPASVPGLQTKTSLRLGSHLQLDSIPKALACVPGFTCKLVHYPAEII